MSFLCQENNGYFLFCHRDALLSPQQVACRLLFILDCYGLCLNTGVQTVPAINTGSILLNAHPYAPGQAHTEQGEASCMAEMPLISSLPPAFVPGCFVSLLLSQSGRTQISNYHPSFYYSVSWCRALLLHLLVSLDSPSYFIGNIVYLPISTHYWVSFQVVLNCGLYPETYQFPVTQLSTGMFFALVYTERPRKLVLTSSRGLHLFCPLNHIPSSTQVLEEICPITLIFPFCTFTY